MADEEHFVSILHLEEFRHPRRPDLVGVSRSHTGGHHQAERGDARRGQNVAPGLLSFVRTAVRHLLSPCNLILLYEILTIAPRDSRRVHLCSSGGAAVFIPAPKERAIELSETARLQLRCREPVRR